MYQPQPGSGTNRPTQLCGSQKNHSLDSSPSGISTEYKEENKGSLSLTHMTHLISENLETELHNYQTAESSDGAT